MILVLASRFDAEAAATAARLGGDGVALVTCDDLSAPGWNLHIGDGGEAVATAPHGVDGVIVRLQHVLPVELPRVHDDDREYVAAEMQAFLAAWLHALGDRVLNPPSAVDLCGLPWRRPRWLRVAAALGVPACGQEWPEQATSVTVVRGHTVQGGDAAHAEAAERLARHTGMGLLRATFDGASAAPRLARVDLWPDLADVRVLDAVVDAFAAMATC